MMEVKDPHTESHLKRQSVEASRAHGWEELISNIRGSSRILVFFFFPGSTTLLKVIYKIPIIIFIDTEKFEDGEMIQWGRRLPPRPEDPGLVSGMNVVEST